MAAGEPSFSWRGGLHQRQECSLGNGLRNQIAIAQLGAQAGGGKKLPERIIGEIVKELGARDKVFIATKCYEHIREPAQRESMATSLKLLKTDNVDLMAWHGVRRENATLNVLKEFRDAGHTRYVGITNAGDARYAATEVVMKREKPDFLQIDLSLDARTYVFAAVSTLVAVVGAGLAPALYGRRGDLFGDMKPGAGGARARIPAPRAALSPGGVERPTSPRAP